MLQYFAPILPCCHRTATQLTWAKQFSRVQGPAQELQAGRGLLVSAGAGHKPPAMDLEKARVAFRVDEHWKADVAGPFKGIPGCHPVPPLKGI